MHLFAEITSASKMVYNRGFAKQMHKRKVIKMNTDDTTPTNTPRQATVSPTPPHIQTITFAPLPTGVTPIDLTGLADYNTIDLTTNEDTNHVDVPRVESLGEVASNLEQLGTALREIDRRDVERRDVDARKKRKWLRGGEIIRLLEGSRTMVRTRRAIRRNHGSIL